MMGYKFSDKLSVEAGKIFSLFGGFEVDENPVYIYEFSDLTGGMECYLGGAIVAYKTYSESRVCRRCDECA